MLGFTENLQEAIRAFDAGPPARLHRRAPARPVRPPVTRPCASSAPGDPVADALRATWRWPDAHVLAARPGRRPSDEAHRARMAAFLDEPPRRARPHVRRRPPDGLGDGGRPGIRDGSCCMLHAKLGRWFQPGGHADGDARAAGGGAGARPTEETGIAGLRVAVPAVDLDIHEVGPPHGAAPAPRRPLPGRGPAGCGAGRQPRVARPALGGVDELPSYGVDEGLLRLARAARHRARGRRAPDAVGRRAARRAEPGGAVRRRWG